MINVLERQFDPTPLKLRWADPLDSEASRMANGFDGLSIKEIKERSGSLLRR